MRTGVMLGVVLIGMAGPTLACSDGVGPGVGPQAAGQPSERNRPRCITERDLIERERRKRQREDFENPPRPVTSAERRKRLEEVRMRRAAAEKAASELRRERAARAGEPKRARVGVGF